MNKKIFVALVAVVFVAGAVGLAGFSSIKKAGAAQAGGNPSPLLCFYNVDINANGVSTGVSAAHYNSLSINTGDTISGAASVSGGYQPGEDEFGNPILPGTQKLTVTEVGSGGLPSHYLSSGAGVYSPFVSDGSSPTIFSSVPISKSMSVKASFDDGCGNIKTAQLDVNVPAIVQPVWYAAGYSYPSMGGWAVDPSNGGFTSPNINLYSIVTAAQEYCDGTGSTRWNHGTSNPTYEIRNSGGAIVMSGTLPAPDLTYYDPPSAGTCGPTNLRPQQKLYGWNAGGIPTISRNFTSQPPGIYTVTYKSNDLNCKDPNWCNINPLPVTTSFIWHGGFANPAGGGAISINTITPDPSQNVQITVAGTAVGGEHSQGGSKCVDPPYQASNSAVKWTPTTLSAPSTFQVDNGATKPFTLNQTQAGVGFVACILSDGSGDTVNAVYYEYNYSFTINGSSLSTGIHVLTVTAHDVFTNKDIQTQHYFMVGVPPPGSVSGAGTINVYSKNSANQQAVPSTWDVIGLNGQTYHTNVSPYATYSNAPLDNYIVAPVAGSAGTLYALKGIESLPIAQIKPGILDGLFALSKDLLFGVAKAAQVCSAYNQPVNLSSDCANFATGSLTLVNNGDVANFVILWDPKGAINASPSPVPLTSSNLSASVTLSNVGAPNSKVTNLSANISDPIGWVNVGSLAGLTLNPGPGTNVTITATPVGNTCDSGCTATIRFKGDPGDGTTVFSNVVTITLTTTAGGGNPSVVIVSPTPAAAGVPVKVDCQGGTGPYSWSATGAPTFSNKNADGSSIYVSYGMPGTYTLTCTDSTNLQDSAPIVITPDCTLTASPTVVVPPQQSTLTWSCVPGTALANSCSLTGQGSNLPTNGSKNVSPATNTIYVLSCDANNGIPGSKIPSTSVTVSVKGPNVIEIP